MKRDTKIKLVFFSESMGKIVIEKIGGIGENSIINNVSTSSSVRRFPTAKLEMSPKNQYANLIQVKSEDAIEIHIDDNMTFKGYISVVKVKFSNEKFDLLLEGVSTFYRFESRKVSFNDFHVKSGLREILNELINICNIDGSIEVDIDISNDFDLQPFKSFPALSFINAICYKLDLVYDFNYGDRMTISKRQDMLSILSTAVPHTINLGDIISSEFQQ